MCCVESQQFELREGVYVDLEDDWRVHVASEDRRQRGVYYVGGYPYDRDCQPLLDDAPMIVYVRDGLAPGSAIPRTVGLNLERKAFGSANDNHDRFVRHSRL